MRHLVKYYLQNQKATTMNTWLVKSREELEVRLESAYSSPYGDLSHEVNNSLNHILGGISEIREHLKSNPTESNLHLSQTVRMIEDAVCRASKAVSTAGS